MTTEISGRLIHMKISILVSLLLVLLSSTANSAETCAISLQSKLTLTQFVELQQATSSNFVVKHDTNDDKCFPQAKGLMIFGKPVCNFNGVTPVIGIAITALKENESIEIAFYMMRGTEQDVEAAMSFYSSRYKDVTDEYLTKIKGPKFHGSTYAWKNGDQYIVLGQRERGFDSDEMSLHLLIGTKEGFEYAGTDSNKCK